MSVKLLTEHNLEFLSLKAGCTGPSVSTLVKMPHCWKSHVAAHMYVYKKTKISLKKISGGDKMDGYFFRKLDFILTLNILVSFDHHSNIIAAGLVLEALLPSENSG